MNDLQSLVAGAQVFENTTDVTSYSYDFAKKELVSYDTPNIVKLKAQYINSQSLAGSMFWEVSRILSVNDHISMKMRSYRPIKLDRSP